MAEEIESPSPDLTALQADLQSSLGDLDNTTSPTLDDSLPAKPESIDTYKNSVGNPITGSNPKLGLVSPEDFAKSSLVESTRLQEDPYIKMRPFTYNGDYDGANFDRYYGTKAYKTLGFTPYRDNDALYNQKMTFGDQFVRAAGQWDNLMATGFMSGVKSWGTLFTDPLAPDLESARDMKRSMAIGNVSTGGVGGFVANTFLNSAYSIGIGLEFLAEEAALAAATAFTGGLAGEVTLPAMAARGGFFARQLGKIAEAGAKIGGKADRFAIQAEKAAGFARRAEEVATKAAGGTDIKSALDFFNKASSGVLDVLNPFEKTAEALKSSRYATDLAKTVGTAGAFADDIIRIKTAASEAQLEGGMVMIDATEKLIDQYRDMNGRDPEGDDLKNIHALASAEARRTTLYNFPAILTTNKLLFSTILYPLNKTVGNTTGKLLKEVVTGDIKAGTQNLFSALEKGAGARIKAAAKSLAKPSIYGEYGMNYLKANIGEGLQENIQEAISAGAISHALAVQKDPATAAYRGYMGYLMDGFKSQMNAQGAETFASGFLMGMFTQPIMTAPAWAISKGIDKITNRADLKAIKEQRDAAIKSQVDALNDLANNDINYWAPDLATAVKNGRLSNDLVQAASMGDEKTARDAKFRIEFNQIATALQSGKFEDLMTKLADYKNLSPAQALEAFSRYGIGINTEAEAGEALKHIDGVVERARAIKDRYEKVAEELPNPYDPSGLKPGSKERQAMSVSYRAWEEAQRNLVFASTEFDNYSQRIGSMTNTFSALASDIAGADTQSLLSTMSLNSMATEISTLKQEIQTLGDVPAQAAVKNQKQKTLDLLEKFYEDIEQAQNTINTENITDYHEKQLVYQDAKESYQKYLTFLAKKNDNVIFNSNVDKAFSLLTDTLEMRSEKERLAKSINVLSNPKGFLLLQKRLQDAFGQEISEKDIRIIQNTNDFLAMQDENNVIQALGQRGVKISEDFLAEYKQALKDKKPLPSPTSFFDPATQKEITAQSDPEKYAEALAAWEGFKAWMELTNNIEEPEPVVEETDEDKKALETFNTYDQELKNTLEGLYNSAKESGDIAEDYTLGQYLNTTSAKTAVSIYAMNKKNQKHIDDLAEEEKKKKEGIPLGTKVNPQARASLNLLGYTNTQVDALSREEREKILLGGIPAEDYYKAKPTEGTTGVKGTIKVNGKVITMEGVPGSIDLTGNQKDTNFDTMMPEITNLIKNWDKDFVNNNLVNYNGQFIFNYDGRVFVLVKVGKFIVPYYFSSSGTSGKAIDWHYVFGVDDNNGWIIKGGVDEKGEMVYSKMFKERYPKSIAELEKIKKEIRTKLAMTPEQRDTVVGQLGFKNLELSRKYSKSLASIYRDLDVVENRSADGIEVNDNYNYLVNATLGLIGLDNVQQAPATADIEAEKAKVTPDDFKEIERLAKFFLENPREPGVVGDARSRYPELFKAVTDIERRRNLSKIVNLDTGISDSEIGATQSEPGVEVIYYLPKGKTTDGRDISKIPSGSIERYTTETKVFYGFEEAEQQAKDWIKSKYDAELTTLQGKPVATTDAESIIERKKKALEGIHGITEKKGKKSVTKWNTYGAGDGIYFTQTDTKEELVKNITDRYNSELSPEDIKLDRIEEIKASIKYQEDQIQSLDSFIANTDSYDATARAERDIRKYKEDLKKLKEELATLEGKPSTTQPAAKSPTSEVKTDYYDTPVNKSKASGNKMLYVPRIVVEKAYENDEDNNSKTKSYGQSLESIIKRNGYAIEELDELLPNWREIAVGEKVEDTQPVEEAIHPEYQGKIIWATPGSGRSEIIKDNKDVVDSDELLLETFRELYPNSTMISNSLSARDNVRDIIMYGPQTVNLDKNKLYNLTRPKLKQMAAKGKTVITSNRDFMKDADFIMVQQNDELLLKGYDKNRDIMESAAFDIPTIAIIDTITNAIKKSPLEQMLAGKTLLNLEQAKANEHLKTNLTIEDINSNLSVNNLAVAQERGYDAIYKNNKYAIAKVSENSVSLKSLDGTEITVKPEDITGVTQQEIVVETPAETQTFKSNDKVLDEEELEFDDEAEDLDEAINNIRKNICD